MRILLAAALVSGGLAAAPALADPTLGVGLTVWFGQGQGQTQTALGFRLFSDDENESLVGSVGVDYVFGGGGVRPTLGLAWLQDDMYLGLDAGLDLSGGPIRVGVGLGGTNTAEPPAAEEVVIIEEPPPET